MLAVVHGCALIGLEGHIVDVEVDYNPRAGLHSFTIVGLPDTAVKESRERVRSAIKNSNRATTRPLHGGTLQEMDLSLSMPEGQNPQEQEEQGFGLQFPNNTHILNSVHDERTYHTWNFPVYRSFYKFRFFFRSCCGFTS